MASAKTTIDHDEIRRWVEERGGHPSHVERTGDGDDPGVLRIDYPGFSGEGTLEEIDWDAFFEAFEANNLAFLYQDEKDSRFSKFVNRDSVDVSSSKKHSSSSKKSSARASSSKKSSSKKASSAKKASGTSSKKASTKKASSSKKASSKKAASTSTKKASSKKAATTKKASSSSSKKASSKKASTTKKAATKKASTKKAASTSSKKASSSKKAPAKKAASTRATSTKSTKASAKASSGSSVTTTDHDEIRRWVEARGGYPAHVKRTTSGKDPGVLRIDYPGFSGQKSLERIEWDQFFEWFERDRLAFVYQNKRNSRFSKLISRRGRR